MELALTREIEIASRPATSAVDAPCTAESAECTCPELCERDHDND